MTSANQTPGGYKFAPLVACQLWRANRNDPACFGLSILSLVLPVTFGHATTACHSPAVAFSATINFAMKHAAPCSAVFCHSHSSWTVVGHWSALIPKALTPSRKHPIHSFSCPPPRSPRPPPILRASRTSSVSYPPCAPQIPRTRFASFVKLPRFSHFPSR